MPDEYKILGSSVTTDGEGVIYTAPADKAALVSSVFVSNPTTEDVSFSLSAVEEPPLSADFDYLILNGLRADGWLGAPYVAYSTDSGATWSFGSFDSGISTGSVTDVSSMVANADNSILLMLIVMDYSTVYSVRSTDAGATWSVNWNFSFPFMDIAYQSVVFDTAAEEFVVLSDYSKASSTDGVTWTSVSIDWGMPSWEGSSGPNWSLNGIRGATGYGGGAFMQEVAYIDTTDSSFATRIVTSTDGLTWTETNLPSPYRDEQGRYTFMYEPTYGKWWAFSNYSGGSGRTLLLDSSGWVEPSGGSVYLGWNKSVSLAVDGLSGQPVFCTNAGSDLYYVDSFGSIASHSTLIGGSYEQVDSVASVFGGFLVISVSDGYTTTDVAVGTVTDGLNTYYVDSGVATSQWPGSYTAPKSAMTFSVHLSPLSEEKNSVYKNAVIGAKSTQVLEPGIALNNSNYLTARGNGLSFNVFGVEVDVLNKYKILGQGTPKAIGGVSEGPLAVYEAIGTSALVRAITVTNLSNSYVRFTLAAGPYADPIPLGQTLFNDVRLEVAETVTIKAGVTLGAGDSIVAKLTSAAGNGTISVSVFGMEL